MGYSSLVSKFGDVRNQYNIMAIVGNGFDIQVLSNLGSTVDTRYESFYYYLKYRKFRSDNRILQKMEQLHHSGETNWSDIEGAIGVILDHDNVPAVDVAKDLKEVQREFSRFLDQVATPDLLANLGDQSVANDWTITSFTNFLGDVADPGEYGKMILPTRLNIGDLFNFQFVNFNYTTLLDDYLYLDQIQFDPHPYQQSDRNINFRPNPRGHSTGKERQGFHMVSYLVSDVVHPHGVQYTPRSLLFGIDSAEGPALKLTKPYWAQNEVKYGDLFADTDLFIIFGCSLGETDGWWWRAIAKTLVEQNNSELMIYWRRSQGENELTDKDVRHRFAAVAGSQAGLEAVLIDKVRVVIYDDTAERAWLNTSQSTVPRWLKS